MAILPGDSPEGKTLPFEPLDQYLQRKRKLAEIEALGEVPYPHRFDQTVTPGEIVSRYASRDTAALEAVCRANLASFKIPRRFEIVEKLPRNALGKVQKHLLKKATAE